MVWPAPGRPWIGIDLEEKAAGTHSQDITIELNEQHGSSADILIQASAQLIAECHLPPAEDYLDSFHVVALNSRALLADRQFCPQAYQPEGSVCPYTHRHPTISGNDYWYGLLMTYSIASGYALDSLAVKVSGTGMGGEGFKMLSLPEGALLGNSAPGACHRIRWEGYDHNVANEPADLPYVWGSEPGTWPAPLGSGSAPYWVVPEGAYSYSIEATDSDPISLDNPLRTLQHSYQVLNIPIRVIYNMNEAVVDSE